MKYEKSCGVVIFREDKFLLLHYDQGHWGFPKGHVEEGENERETALRELEEETGISDVKFVPGFRHKVQYTYKAGGVVRNKQVFFFLAEVDTEDVELTEHQGYDWLPYEEALERVTYDEVKGILKVAMEHLKAHDSRLDQYF